MYHNNKHHLSKQEKELLKKLTEDQQEFYDMLTNASHEFEIFAAEMEDMKGSVENMDSQIKEKEPVINKSLEEAYNTLISVKKYFENLKDADNVVSSDLITEVNNSIQNLEINFPTLVKS